MRINLRLSAPALLAALCLAGTGNSADLGAIPSPATTCGDYGTSVHFEKNPSEAARKALQEEKLVMVLHVSGDFENPEFT